MVFSKTLCDFTDPGAGNPEPETRSPNPGSRNPKPQTQSLKPQTRSPKPQSRNLQPEARDPKHCVGSWPVFCKQVMGRGAPQPEPPTPQPHPQILIPEIIERPVRLSIEAIIFNILREFEAMYCRTVPVEFSFTATTGLYTQVMEYGADGVPACPQP